MSGWLRGYNSGDSRSWNSHMRLGFGYDEAEQRMYYAISCPPNLSGGEIVNNSYLQDAYGRCLVITQPAGGSLRQCDVDFIADEASQRLRTVVHQTQPYVRYELSRDRATVATGWETTLTASCPATSLRALRPLGILCRTNAAVGFCPNCR